MAIVLKWTPREAVEKHASMMATFLSVNKVVDVHFVIINLLNVTYHLLSLYMLHISHNVGSLLYM